MNFVRVRFWIALALFLGWLSWLGYAVWYNQYRRPDALSRAQLTGADLLVVAEVKTNSDGQPEKTVVVTKCISGKGPAVGQAISIGNLASAQPPGRTFPGPGEYLLPLIASGTAADSFLIGELPRSPGHSPTRFVRPVVYPWNEAVQTQLRTLGYQW
jgi:hypothetical protein